MNKVFIIGNLGKDPVVRTTNSDKQVANFSIAVRGWGKDAEPTWFRVVAWNKMADIADRYLNKGDRCAIVGRLQTGSYTDKDGNKRDTWEIIASELELLGSKDKEERPEAAGDGDGGGRGRGRGRGRSQDDGYTQRDYD